MKFINLHGHSTLSVGDATGFPKEHFDYVLKNAAEDSMACALSEHGNANGFGYMAAAQREYKSKGVPFKVIYAVEFYLHPDLDEWRLLKNTKEVEDTEVVIENEAESKSKWADPLRRRHHVVVIATNQEGLKNLFRLVSKSYREGFYRFPRIDFKMLEQHQKGLMISTACLHPDSVLRTNLGDISILEVIARVNQGENILVASFDIAKEQIVFKSVIGGACTRKAARLIKIKCSNGKELKLTPDHKVFTNQGWVEAQQLTKFHKILNF